MGRAVLNLLLLDTHVLVWLLEGVERLGGETRRLADQGRREDGLLVSAITFWEVAMLTSRRSLLLGQSVAAWRRKVLELGIGEVPLSGDIGIMAAEFKDFPPDPADRIIAATAMVSGATLVTADEGVLGWPGQLGRHDARR